MRKPLAILCAACLASSLSAAPGLIVVTPSLTEAPDEYRAALILAGRNPGAVAHLVIEDAILRKKERVSEFLAAAAAPESVKTLIVSPAPAGTLSAFQDLAASRPALYRVAIGSREDPLAMEQASSLVAGPDAVGRAWALARSAALRGMSEIAFLSSPLPAFGEDEDLRFKAVLRAQCSAEGILLSEKPVGQDLDAFLRERAAARPGKVLVWNQESRIPAELASLAGELKLPLAEGPLPSLLTDLAGPAGLDPATEDADYQKVLKKAEKTIIDAGLAGRYSTWVLPQGWILTLALGRACLEGDLGPRKAVLLDKVQRHFAKVATGIRYGLAYRVDPQTGIRSQNHLVFRQDPYILGKGFLSLGSGGPSKQLQLLTK